MSNSLAVAATTTCLRWILERSLHSAEPGGVSGATVTTLRPDQLAKLLDGDDPASGLNIFCYMITPNHAGNLVDLPTRHGDGNLAARPVAAVDLHYLITGYGHDATLDAQRLLARAVLALAVMPALTRSAIERAIATYHETDGMDFLDEVDLADQADLVKFSPTTLSLEELSKLWGVLGTPYLPSLTYTATMVLLQASVTPRTALPVRARFVGIRAAGPPRLQDVQPQDPAAPVVVGARLLLTGSGLQAASSGQVTVVRIGPVELTPATITATQVDIVLTDAVPAGLHPITILHRTVPTPGGGPSRVMATSNALAVLLRPTVAVPTPAIDPIVLQVSPPILARQAAVVSLSRLSGGAPDESSWSGYEVPIGPPGTPPRTEVQLPAGSVGDGVWLVRIEVAGAVSVPDLVGGTYGAPTVTR
jgi:hypothetical protein